MSDFTDWISDNKGKFASIIVCMVYLIAFLIGTMLGEVGAQHFFQFIAFLILPLACIWFGEYLGGYIGFSKAGGPRITQASPGCLVSFVGWILLLLPLIVTIIAAMSN